MRNILHCASCSFCLFHYADLQPGLSSEKSVFSNVVHLSVSHRWTRSTEPGSRIILSLLLLRANSAADYPSIDVEWGSRSIVLVNLAVRPFVDHQTEKRELVTLVMSLLPFPTAEQSHCPFFLERLKLSESSSWRSATGLQCPLGVADPPARGTLASESADSVAFFVSGLVALLMSSAARPSANYCPPDF